MKKTSILLLAICTVALSPMAFGGTFATSVIQNTSPPTAEQCILGGFHFIDWTDSEVAGGETAREISWEPNHHATTGGYADANCNWRHEVMQTFEARADANMGAAAFMLRKLFWLIPPGVPDTCDANYAPVDTAGGRDFIISLYAMKDWRASVPQGRNLLMKWRATLPAGIDSNAKDDAGKADPNSGHAGDWLKFTFSPGFSLKKGQQYGIRLAFASPFPAVPGDPLPDPNLHEIQISCCFNAGDLEYYDYMHESGAYARGSACEYQPEKHVDRAPYWQWTGRDFNFAIFPAASGTLVATSKRAGETYWDGKVQLADFAVIAKNWDVNTRKTEPNIPYLLDNYDAPTTVFKDIIVVNDQPPASPDPCLTPRIEWRYDPNTSPSGLPLRDGVPVCKYQQIGQSFRAPSSTTMGAIAVQIATGAFDADPCSADTRSVTEQTSGHFTINVYSVATATTPPQSGTLLATFSSGSFPQLYDWIPFGDYSWAEDGSHSTKKLYGKDLYGQFYLYRAANMGDWITFILPSTVSLTANNYYAFTLIWNSNAGYNDFGFPDDPKLRRFYVDTSAPGGTDVYANGTAFYTDSNSVTSTYVTGTFDLDFAILGPQYICNSGINPNAMGFQDLEGDLNGDCRVDKKDVDILADNWLLSNLITIP